MLSMIVVKIFDFMEINTITEFYNKFFVKRLNFLENLFKHTQLKFFQILRF